MLLHKGGKTSSQVIQSTCVLRVFCCFVSPVLSHLISMHSVAIGLKNPLIIQPDKHQNISAMGLFHISFLVSKHQNPTPAAHQAKYLYKLKHHDYENIKPQAGNKRAWTYQLQLRSEICWAPLSGPCC